MCTQPAADQRANRDKARRRPADPVERRRCVSQRRNDIHQQHRHHRDEHLLRQVQQQPGAQDGAKQRGRQLPTQPIPLTCQLTPVAQVPETLPATNPTALDIVDVTGG